MTTFAVTLGLFAAVMAGLGIGAIVDGRRLRGSCGDTCACSSSSARFCSRRGAAGRGEQPLEHARVRT
jgi:hypothetical protein